MRISGTGAGKEVPGEAGNESPGNYGSEGSVRLREGRGGESPVPGERGPGCLGAPLAGAMVQGRSPQGCGGKHRGAWLQGGPTARRIPVAAGKEGFPVCRRLPGFGEVPGFPGMQGCRHIPPSLGRLLPEGNSRCPKCREYPQGSQL